MRSNPSLTPLLKPNNIIQHTNLLLVLLLYGFKYIAQYIKMITKSLLLHSILRVLWVSVRFGSKLGSKPARKARRNTLKITRKPSKYSISPLVWGYSQLSVAVWPADGGPRGEGRC